MDNKDIAGSTTSRKKKSHVGLSLRMLTVLVFMCLLTLVLVVVTLTQLMVGFAGLDAMLERTAAGKGYNDSMKASTMPCVSSSCVRFSGDILSRMDSTVDPCEDFYRYACGGFVEDPLIPDNARKWSTMTALDKRNKMHIRQALEEPHDNSTGAVKKAKMFYYSCLNNEARKDSNVEGLHQLLHEVGSWPLVSSNISGEWSASGWVLEDALAAAHRLSVSPFITEKVAPDDKNTSVHRIELNQNYVPLLKMSSNDSVVRLAFSSFLNKLVEILDGNVTDDDVDDVWQLNTAINQMRMSIKEYRVDITKRYNLMTLDDVHILLNHSLDLTRFLSTLHGRPFTRSQPVIVRVPEVFQELGQILQRTTPRTLAIYIGLWVLHDVGPQASPVVRRFIDGFLLRPELPAWQYCVTQTANAMPFAVGWMFASEHFSETDKQEIEELVENIRESFLSSLDHLDWMDDVTKEQARVKAREVSHKIGYPEFSQIASLLDEYYEEMNVSDDYLVNWCTRLRFASNKALSKLGTPLDRDRWLRSPIVVNAYYYPKYNDMTFPAAILQYPVYDTHLPRSLVYGSIGGIMGHELIHGFDNLGRLYDERGNMYNWWNNASTQEFRARTRCLVEQYNQYDLGGFSVDGELTLSENIADNGAVRLSHRAYTTWLDHHREQPVLPGLTDNNEQLFFLGYAQTFCTYYPPQVIPGVMTSDVHAAASIRVVGPLSNSEHFARAYSCPLGSAMNPTNKCLVWA